MHLEQNQHNTRQLSMSNSLTSRGMQCRYCNCNSAKTNRANSFMTINVNFRKLQFYTGCQLEITMTTAKKPKQTFQSLSFVEIVQKHCFFKKRRCQLSLSQSSVTKAIWALYCSSLYCNILLSQLFYIHILVKNLDPSNPNETLCKTIGEKCVCRELEKYTKSIKCTIQTMLLGEVWFCCDGIWWWYLVQFVS